jgi:hypothetical protein
MLPVHQAEPVKSRSDPIVPSRVDEEDVLPRVATTGHTVQRRSWGRQRRPVSAHQLPGCFPKEDSSRLRRGRAMGSTCYGVCVSAGPRTLARRSSKLSVNDLSTLSGGWRTFLGGQVGQDQNGPRASSWVRWTALPRARTASGARLASQLACTRSGREGSPRELSITPA